MYHLFLRYGVCREGAGGVDHLWCSVCLRRFFVLVWFCVLFCFELIWFGLGFVLFAFVDVLLFCFYFFLITIRSLCSKQCWWEEGHDSSLICSQCFYHQLQNFVVRWCWYGKIINIPLLILFTVSMILVMQDLQSLWKTGHFNDNLQALKLLGIFFFGGRGGSKSQKSDRS